MSFGTQKFLILYIYFIYLFLAALGLRCCAWALVAASGGYSVVVHELLIAVASLVAEHGL